VITRVCRAPAQVDLSRVRNSRRQLIARLFVDPGLPAGEVYRQQLRVVKMVLGRKPSRTLRASSRRKAAIRNFDAAPTLAITAASKRKLAWPTKMSESFRSNQFRYAQGVDNDR
jgi:hypothetical protein